MPKDKYAGSDPDPTPYLFVSPEQKRADQVGFGAIMGGLFPNVEGVTKALQQIEPNVT